MENWEIVSIETELTEQVENNGEGLDDHSLDADGCGGCFGLGCLPTILFLVLGFLLFRLLLICQAIFS